MYVVELEEKISNSVLPLKTRLLERMQLRTDFKPPSNVTSQTCQTQPSKQVQAPPIQLQKQRYQQPLAHVPYATFHNGITKDNIGHGNYPAIIQLADVENSAKILITEVRTVFLLCTDSVFYILLYYLHVLCGI